MHLTGTKITSTGVIVATYHHAGAPGYGSFTLSPEP